MAWARIDDNFFSHPKVRKAGKDAVILYMAALCHSNAYMTEGFIADDVLDLIGIQAFQNEPKSSANKLVECGLFIRVEGGYQIHDFLEYNYSRQQINDIKAKRAQAGRQGGRPTKQNESKTKANEKQNESHTHTHINTHTNTDINPTNQSSSIAEKGDDDDLYKAFETIAAVTPEVRKAIDQAADSYGAAWVRDAIAEGVVHGAKSFAYVNRILASWKANGKPSNGHKQPGADVERFRELYRQQKQGAK